ncbi:MAG: folylpolyglutamate synthase/dihydrofolate synthase family protein [Thermohalobaculum sp.]|nr:folylpolyglutamate synthase/dihydrofolate synthase family protein [Thermohalobaculum sp.]
MLALHPKVIDLTLERVERLLARLGHPERAVPPVVHVAGTNGKGSTVAMLRAGFEAAGERVHVYTSPHLARFHERIRVAGHLIGEPALAALLEECERVNGAEPITFFEITTAAAFLAFARTPAERLLLEVGLGGRLDATNVIARPALTIITPVSIDHQQYLGETLPEIAGEKAGILKPGVPCVVGPQPDAARAVIEARAAAIGAPLMPHGQDWMARAEHGRLVYEDERGLLDLSLPNLPGLHQIDNAGAAIAALRLLGQDDAACAAAVTRAEWPARMQRLRHGPLVEHLPPGVELWLDGGHNASAGEALAATLDQMAAQGARPVPVRLIVGMIDTKAAEDFLAPLAGKVGPVATVTIPATPAAIPAETLAARARTAGHDATATGSVDAALDHVLAGAEAPLRVLICGSLYLAGQVLTENG